MKWAERRSGSLLVGFWTREKEKDRERERAGSEQTNRHTHAYTRVWIKCKSTFSPERSNALARTKVVALRSGQASSSGEPGAEIEPAKLLCELGAIRTLLARQHAIDCALAPHNLAPDNQFVACEKREKIED